MAPYFRDRYDVEDWLNGKPAEWARAIAVRAALRAFLELLGEGVAPGATSQRVVAAIRAMFLSWAAAKYPLHDIRSFASRASAGLVAAGGLPGGSNAERAAFAAITNSIIATAATASNATIVSYGAATADARWLEGHTAESLGGAGLIDQPLWLDGEAARSAGDWFTGSASRVIAKHDYAPWIAWFNALLPADPAASPSDYFGEALTIRIAAQLDAWWNRPPEEINADIARWLEERDRITTATEAVRSVPDIAPALLPLGLREGRIAALPPDPVADDPCLRLCARMWRGWWPWNWWSIGNCVTAGSRIPLCGAAIQDGARVTPAGLLEHARELLRDGGLAPEGAMRGAAHAAYYACFHLVARRFGLDPSDRRQARHEQLLARLRGEAPGDPLTAIGATALTRLQHLRTQADYDLGAPFDRNEALRALVLAETIFSAAPGGGTR